MEFCGDQSDHLRSRQLAVSKRLQKSFHADQNVEKLKQLERRKQQQNSRVEVDHRRSQFDDYSAKNPR